MIFVSKNRPMRLLSVTGSKRYEVVFTDQKKILSNFTKSDLISWAKEAECLRTLRCVMSQKGSAALLASKQ